MSANESNRHVADKVFMAPHLGLKITPRFSLSKATALILCILLGGLLAFRGVAGHRSHHIEPAIAGPPGFQVNTHEALAVLSLRAPEFHELVARNVRQIRPGSRTKFNVVQRVADISEHEVNSPSEWYAAVLVHEAFHGELYLDHWWRRLMPISNKPKSWKGQEAEVACLNYQADALLALGYDPLIAERVRQAWEGNAYWLASLGE